MLFKKILPLCFALALSATVAHAEGESSDNFNLHFGPISALVGVVDIGLDVAVHPNWTVGPTFSYLKRSISSTGTYTSNFDVTGFAIGGRANWYMDGVFTDGLYVSPSLNYTNVTIKTKDSTGDVTGEASPLIAVALVGYAWFWDQFNIHLGGGLSLPLGDSKIKIRDSAGTVEEVDFRSTGSLAIEFNLGWTF